LHPYNISLPVAETGQSKIIRTRKAPNAELIWRVGINDEMVVSEIYDPIQILDRVRR